ncbi:MAG: hypothetical protein IPM79_07745 [Polyangiaceae bacterium]|nr:hypothetical protein [Polyangiaceae bacterium]
MLRRFGPVTAVALAACTFDFDAVGPQPSGGGPSHGGGGSALTGGASAGGANAGGGGASSGGSAAGGGGSGGASDGGGAQGGAGGTCDVGTCLDIPGEFSAMFTIDRTPCASSSVIEGGVGVNGAMATCNCSCELPDDLGCADLGIRRFSQVGCAGQAAAVSLAEDICMIQPIGTLGYSSDPPGGTASGTCVTDAEPPTVPLWSFQEAVWGCPLGLEQSCDVGKCVPSGACIYSETAATCPAGFNVAPVIARASDVVDTRTCTCACGTFFGTCSAEVEMFGDTGCLGSLTPVIQELCWADMSDEEIRGLRYAPTTNATCGAATPLALGDVSAPTAPLLCCAP